MRTSKLLKAVKALKQEKEGEKVTCGTLPKVIKKFLDKGWPTRVPQLDALRASGVHDICPREFVFNYFKPEGRGDFGHLAYFRMTAGTHLHEFLQDVVLGPMGVLFGSWEKVNAEGYVVEEIRGYHPDPERGIWEHVHQKPVTWRFKEDNYWHEKLRISGHTDGQVCFEKLQWLEDNWKLVVKDIKTACNRLHSLSTDESNRKLLEVKTTSSYGFKKILEADSLALPEYYKTQAEIYQEMSGIKETVFFYVDRDTMNFHCFPYTFHGGPWKGVVFKANSIWRAIKNETLPEQFACTMKTNERAKKCPHSEACFLKGLRFKDWVQIQKKAQPEREWLDLSSWEPYKI